MSFDPTPFDCPGDEVLAVFADGRLRGRARHTLCSHLLDCAACYSVFRAFVRDRADVPVPSRVPLVPLG